MCIRDSLDGARHQAPFGLAQRRREQQRNPDRNAKKGKAVGQRGELQIHGVVGGDCRNEDDSDDADACPVDVMKMCIRDSSLSMAMKVTETPRPISVRPASAQSSDGANPNMKLPRPPMMPPSARIRRGPSVSARIPVGICISV